jgi:hypothetical protein
MVMVVLSLRCVKNGFDYAIGHPYAEDIEGIPEPSHKHYMTHIPNPFKIKGKHNSSSFYTNSNR